MENQTQRPLIVSMISVYLFVIAILLGFGAILAFINMAIGAKSFAGKELLGLILICVESIIYFVVAVYIWKMRKIGLYLFVGVVILGIILSLYLNKSSDYILIAIACYCLTIKNKFT